MKKGSKMSEETKKKISVSVSKLMTAERREQIRQDNFKNPRKYWLGKKRSDETNEKIRRKLIGNKNSLGYKFTNEQKENLSKAHIKSKISVYLAHQIMKRRYGKPDYCEHCERIDKKKYEWANKDHKYNLEKENWMRLCTLCHNKYDIKYNGKNIKTSNSLKKYHESKIIKLRIKDSNNSL